MKEHVAWSDGHKITRGGDAHKMMIKEIKHVEMDMEQSDQGKGIIVGFAFAGLRWVEKWLTGFRIDSRLSRGAITVSS
jgi:hypothetical protein